METLLGIVLTIIGIYLIVDACIKMELALLELLVGIALTFFMIVVIFSS